MSFLGNETQRELTTERVPGGRRAALVAVVAALAVVGALVWRPWDSPTTRPSPAPLATAPLIAVATANPALPSAAPPGPSGAAGAGPEIPIGPILFDAPGGLGSVAVFVDEGPVAWCIYRDKPRQDRLSLAIIVVEPPVVLPEQQALSAGSLHAASWHVELESNSQDKIFEAAWQPSATSEAARVDLERGQYGFVKPISIKVPAADSLTVYRTPILVDWLGKGDEVLAEQLVQPATYGTLGAPSAEPAPGGCPARI